jgi:hypothetical protein
MEPGPGSSPDGPGAAEQRTAPGPGLEEGDLLLDPGLRTFLLRNVDVSERDLDKILRELVDHFSETVPEFVRRRHRELLRQGVPGRDSYGRIAAEVAARRFAGPSLSERQVRRLIYG